MHSIFMKMELSSLAKMKWNKTDSTIFVNACSQMFPAVVHACFVHFVTQWNVNRNKQSTNNEPAPATARIIGSNQHENKTIITWGSCHKRAIHHRTKCIREVMFASVTSRKIMCCLRKESNVLNKSSESLKTAAWPMPESCWNSILVIWVASVTWAVLNPWRQSWNFTWLLNMNQWCIPVLLRLLLADSAQSAPFATACHGVSLIRIPLSLFSLPLLRLNSHPARPIVFLNNWMVGISNWRGQLCSVLTDPLCATISHFGVIQQGSKNVTSAAMFKHDSANCTKQQHLMHWKQNLAVMTNMDRPFDLLDKPCHTDLHDQGGWAKRGVSQLAMTNSSWKTLPWTSHCIGLGCAQVKLLSGQTLQFCAHSAHLFQTFPSHSCIDRPFRTRSGSASN